MCRGAYSGPVRLWERICQGCGKEAGSLRYGRGDMVNGSENTKGAEKSKSDAAYVELAKDALKNYFGVQMTDTAAYSVTVQYIEAMPEYEFGQQTAVISLPEKISLDEVSGDTVIDMEQNDTKPMYGVSFNANGEV